VYVLRRLLLLEQRPTNPVTLAFATTSRQGLFTAFDGKLSD